MIWPSEHMYAEMELIIKCQNTIFFSAPNETKSTIEFYSRFNKGFGPSL